MSTVKMIPEEEAVGRVKVIYDEIKAQLGIDFVPNLYRVMAQKPQYLEANWNTKLAREAKDYDAVIVLGCDSATETVREVLPPHVKVIEGMKTTGIMNGRMSFRLPDQLVFDGCKVVPISPQKVA